MTETFLSTNKKRSAHVGRNSTPGPRYVITLIENRRFGSSVRQKKATTKPDAVKLARAWVKR